MPDLIRHPSTHKLLAMKHGYTYILCDKPYGTLYVGVTSDLIRRMAEHRQGFADGFTKKYKIKRLVHFEMTLHIEEAIHREKQLKNWLRDWKIELINQHNPEWEDLSVALMDAGSSPA